MEPNGEFLMVFYSANMDQKALPVGLTIYPRIGKYRQKSLPWFDPKLNPLCYPLLFPNGEQGWTWHKFPYQEPKPVEQRLISMKEKRMKWDNKECSSDRLF